MNYTKNKYKIQENSSYSWIFFKIYNGLGVEWYDIKLPYPNYLLHARSCYYIGWCIAGSESKYLEEIKERFVATLKDYTVEILSHKPPKNDLAHTNDTLYRLADFNVLDSIKTRVRAITDRGNLFTVDNDEAFLQIKFYCEYLIKKNGVPSYQDLEHYAFSTFPNHKKGRSTLRAKCRSIYNWYADRDFKCGRANSKYENLEQYWESTMATRKEHMIKVNKKLAEDTRKKVLNLAGGMFKDEYIKPSGKWNITKLAKDAGVSRDSVYKYLEELSD